MARNRMIKPEFWEDDRVAECSFQARLFFIALWNLSDDEGFFEYRPKWLKAKAFPYDDILSEDIEKIVAELSSIGRVMVKTTNNGNRIGHVVNFLKHQRIDRPKKSDLSQLFNDSTNVPRAIDEQSTTKRKGKEVKRKEVKVSGKKEFDEDTKKLSDFLFELIKQNNPSFKGDPRKWDSDFDKLLRIDKRDYNESAKLLQLVQEDDFWRANILSGQKFREKYDQLYLKLMKEKTGGVAFIS